ncbi:MAG: DUF1573 domain-containing protein [Thermoguttaceae bacterium]
MFAKTLPIFASILFFLTQPGSAQEWVNELFEVKNHDFGVVPKDAKVEYRFPVYNPYVEDIRISNVESSCVCSTPTVEQTTIKSNETGYILVHFNTDKVKGPQKATIRVKFDKPYTGKAALQVTGNVRTDVSFSPASVVFGDVPVGEEREKIVKVLYQGRNSFWSLKEVKSDNPHITTEILDTKLLRGGAETQIKVKLRPDAPVGELGDRIFIVTSEPKSNSIPLMIEGRVNAPITAKPDQFNFGALHAGEKAVRPLVVSGVKPFRIKNIKTSDKAITVDSGTTAEEQPRKLYVMQLTFEAPDVKVISTLKEQVEIETDNPDVTPCISISAVVQPKEDTDEKTKELADDQTTL